MGLFGTGKKELSAMLAEQERTIEEQRREIERLKTMSCPEANALEALKAQVAAVQEQYSTVLERLQNATSEEEQLEARIIEQKDRIERQKAEIVHNDIEIEIQEYGIYTPTYEFANSDLYKDALKKVRNKQKELVAHGEACSVGATNWAVDGNKAAGNQMMRGLQKLLLRAFNTECDNVVASVRVSNYDRCFEKIKKSRETISKCCAIMGIRISDEYLELKRQELLLSLDFEQKKQEEKERLRELREQQREEAKAQKEIEEARKRLAKEQAHYENALKAISAQLEKDPENPDLLAKKKELETSVADTLKAIEDVDYREANKRAGYVYIISNIGAFGENVYKIGMTRRLDPMDRVHELGDASVPFGFDVHALIFAEDAPALEAALHKAFVGNKVNKVNPRREFFRVSLEEIKRVVRENFDKTVEWVDFPAAEQYRQSICD